MPSRAFHVPETAPPIDLNEFETTPPAPTGYEAPTLTPVKIAPGPETPPVSQVEGSQINPVAGQPVTQAEQVEIERPGQAPAVSNAFATAAESQGYDAATAEVSDEARSAHQLQEILAIDSPLFRRAKSKALDMANARGLGNSSFAVGSALGAVTDRASPLAQQDAQTYFQNTRANVDAENQSRAFGAAAANRASEVNANLETAVSQTNAAAQNTQNMSIMEMDHQLRTRNAELESARQAFNAGQANQQQTALLEMENQRNIRQAELDTATAQFNAGEINKFNVEVMNQDFQTRIRQAELDFEAGRINSEQLAAQRSQLAAEQNAINRQAFEANAELSRMGLQATIKSLLTDQLNEAEMAQILARGDANSRTAILEALGAVAANPDLPVEALQTLEALYKKYGALADAEQHDSVADALAEGGHATSKITIVPLGADPADYVPDATGTDATGTDTPGPGTDTTDAAEIDDETTDKGYGFAPNGVAYQPPAEATQGPPDNPSVGVVWHNPNGYDFVWDGDQWSIVGPRIQK